MEKERYLLVAVATGDEDEAWASLDELKDLLKTAGGEAVEGFIQRLPHPDPATYTGSGKARELGELTEAYRADGILCDDELSPMQLKNLSEITGGKVIDRTMLILDIFAAHARTKEGQIQVEMAQLKYRMSRLRGMGVALSRLGGGIGTRGPGETKLETDRRAIKRKVAALSSEIERMKNVRETTRKKRQGSALPTAAIVGYTNAGKSTLLNKLTSSDILAEDKLFATLDPTTRVCRLEDGQEVLLTDTVGFINKLPHHLIDAFRSTLEEAKYADYIIHVVDGSNEDSDLRMKVVYDTLNDLGVTGKPILLVINKSDLPAAEDPIRDPLAQKSIHISAKTGKGIDELANLIAQMIREGRKHIDTVLSYTEGSKLSLIRKYGQLLSEEYEADGIHITAYIPAFLEGDIRSADDEP
ncbi:MAG: GTPase HflX [Lachnospiraceae bacterium]|nr:GTPase HflX [Lachnospiraceae bacterium]